MNTFAENDDHEILASIREGRLRSYQATPADILEHCGLEDQIAQNYRGRLVYEMLQNADDAMDGICEQKRRVFFRLTHDALLVANTGRPISEADVRALCGLSVSSQTTKRVANRRRATIGQKGVGFKSILEITSRPETHSTGISFRFDQGLSERLLQETQGLDGYVRADRIPIMRLPFSPASIPGPVQQALDDGFATVFWFPLREDVPAVRDRIAKFLSNVSSRSVMFLRHVDELTVNVEDTSTRGWQIAREINDSSGDWLPAESLPNQGVARVRLDDIGGKSQSFMVFVDREIEIGPHRAGLDQTSWEGVELTEAAVAVALNDEGDFTPVRTDPRIHVFLPTEERCPFPFLINGAFSCDLSRQSIRVGSGEDDYNRFLLRRAVNLVRDGAIPTARQIGQPTEAVLRLLDRHAVVSNDGQPLILDTDVSHCLLESARRALADVAFIPIVDGQASVCLKEIAIPPSPSSAREAGPAIRALIGHKPTNLEGPQQYVPRENLCRPEFAKILLDLGAQAITCNELPSLLEVNADQIPATLRDEKIYVDAVVELVVELWHNLPSVERESLAQAVRNSRLFPVGDLTSDGCVRHVAIGRGTPCFYPPRGVRANVPLPGVIFMSHAVCWGKLTPPERTQELQREITAWQGLWGVEEFKFDSVMRAAILPKLALREQGGTESEELQDLDVLAAICQLSSRRSKPESPLVHERVGTQRNLFPLCRLPVPCRSSNDDIEWVPAFKAYFSRSWLGDESVEVLLEGVPNDAPIDTPPFVVDVEVLRPHLSRYRFLDSSLLEDEADSGDVLVDEADENEDEDVPLDAPEDERWRHFLAWIGVNSHLRPIGLLDVNSRGTWTSTADLVRPEGRGALSRLSVDGWKRYQAQLLRGVRDRKLEPKYHLYLYRVYDLELLPDLLQTIHDFPDSKLSTSLFLHLAVHWNRLSALARVQVAAPETATPNRRGKPVRAYDHEIATIGESPWLWRLRGHEWCPTGHGPRVPKTCWLPSQEVIRRFKPKNDWAEILLPTVALEIARSIGAASRFQSDLGIRSDLNPSTFLPHDCIAVANRLKLLFDSSSNEPDRRWLREIVNPTYRHLFELLPATRAERASKASSEWRQARDLLIDVPLLAHDAVGNLAFLSAKDIVHAGRRDTIGRIGLQEGLWTFVLEGHPAALAPLREYFGCKILEDILQGIPVITEPGFSPGELAEIEKAILKLAPFILCRLEADRAAPRLIEQDARNLREVLNGLEPVGNLEVTYSVGTFSQGKTSSKLYDYFWQTAPVRKLFVRWGEVPWPPSASACEGLAAGICEALNVSAFEPILALIRAGSEDERRRLLVRAAAPHDNEALLHKRELLTGENEPTEHTGDLGLPEPKASVTLDAPESDEAVPADEPTEGPETEQRPLWNPADLVFEDESRLVTGEFDRDADRATGDADRQGGSGAARGSGRRSRTDLTLLDWTGMSLAMRYERLRLSSSLPACTIFNPEHEDTWRDALVFDVSTPDAIAAARKSCPTFDAALKSLVNHHGLSEDYPGFDILSLKSATVSSDPFLTIDRMIELKSSGVHARLQEMTWNEWKTAENGILAVRYWLYLIGNLRSDLNGSKPFLQMIRNPFARIRAVAVTEQSLKRKIQIHTGQFEEAEIIDLRTKGKNPAQKKEERE